VTGGLGTGKPGPASSGKRGNVSYAIKVIDKENDEEGFVCDGMSDTPTRYSSKRKAQEFAEFMRIGMEEKIIVVPYPRREKGQSRL